MEDIQLDPKQLEAVELCTRIDPSNKVASVTGPAGTGKTTIIKQSYDVLTEAGYSVVVAAPTGKAAKRIREATGIQSAKTIHKLLEYTMPGEINEDTGKPARYSYPRRDHEKPLDEDVIIVDEFAMVNQELYRNIKNAMTSRSVLRAFGDINQLQPIEPNHNAGIPSPFQFMLDPKNRLNKVVLETLHRHGKDAIIAQNSRRILQGRIPANGENFALRQVDPGKILPTILQVARKLIERGTPTFNSIDAQIITPQSTGASGTYMLNSTLRELYNGGTQDLITLERYPHIASKSKQDYIPLSIGDKVMVTKNYYDLRPRISDRYGDPTNLAEPIPPQAHEEVFNGEVGLVTSIDDGYISIDVGDRVVVVPPYMEYIDEKGSLRDFNPHKDIDLAYAITTHKAQGSEYKNVLYVVSQFAQYLQCRANFYTGVTRARDAVMVVGDSKSLGLYSMRKTPPSQFKKG